MYAALRQGSERSARGGLSAVICCQAAVREYSAFQTRHTCLKPRSAELMSAPPRCSPCFLFRVRGAAFFRYSSRPNLIVMHPQVDAQLKHSRFSPYGYQPDIWIGILFIVLFGLSTICHLVQGIHYRLWWILPTIVLAGCMELIGWAGRLWSGYNVLLNTPYLMQIVCTILAPTPLVAASFVMLGQCIRRLGQQYSRLSAKWYTAVFCSCDVIALVIQALGGASASAAVNQGKSAKTGGNIMLAGIVFQLVAITFYMLLAAEFVLRYLYNKPIKAGAFAPTAYGWDSKFKQMIAALAFSSLCIYVRSWYRTIELANGWQGYIIHTERYFVIMDALMITFAMWIMNICHPGRLLGPAPTWYDASAPAAPAGEEQPRDSENWTLKGEALSSGDKQEA